MERDYPWYDIVVSSGILEQGDLLFDCPVFTIAEHTDFKKSDELVFQWETRDVIVMSQTCDLEHDKLKDV